MTTQDGRDITKEDDLQKVPRDEQPDGWQYRRPDDQPKRPPNEPVQAEADYGSLDLPDTEEPVEPLFEPSF